MGAAKKNPAERRLLELLGSPRYQPLNKSELAKELQRPVLVHAAATDDGRRLRRLLGIIRDSGVEPDRVLALQAPRAGLRLIRGV